jgi:hypothetical protein
MDKKRGGKKGKEKKRRGKKKMKGKRKKGKGNLDILQPQSNR